jgi:hypothetical protein
MDKLKTILSKIKMPKLKMPKVKLPQLKMPKVKTPKLPKISFPKLNMNKVKPFLVKLLPIIKKSLNLLIKAAKGLILWFGKAIKESIAQVWTLLGFFIAWLTLTGTAQQIVGIATIFATILWLITIPLREEKEE